MEVVFTAEAQALEVDVSSWLGERPECRLLLQERHRLCYRLLALLARHGHLPTSIRRVIDVALEHRESQADRVGQCLGIRARRRQFRHHSGHEGIADVRRREEPLSRHTSLDCGRIESCLVELSVCGHRELSSGRLVDLKRQRLLKGG